MNAGRLWAGGVATAEEQIATALIDLAIVLAIAPLVSGAADRSQHPSGASRRSPRPGDAS